MLITGNDVHFVILVFTFIIWLLNAASGRSVIAGDGQSDSRTVTEINRLLYQAFPERTASDNGATVVILNGSGKNFTGRGRSFINQNDDWDFLAASGTVGEVIFSWCLASFRIDDELSFWQELVDHLNGRSHISASVAAKVNDNALTVFLMEFGQRNQHFRISGFTELVDFDISELFVHHISSVYTFHWNITADNGKVQKFFFPLAEDSQFHFASFRAFQLLHGCIVGYYFTYKSGIIHFHNAVSGHQAHFF